MDKAMRANHSVIFHAKLYRSLLLAAALAFFLITVLGGMVRATQSGGACPDWPTCLGSWTPPAGGGELLDYLHRAVTGLSIVLLLAATWAYRRRLQTVRQAASQLVGIQAGTHDLPSLLSGAGAWTGKMLYLALGLLVLQVVLGAGMISAAAEALRGTVNAIHLILSLLILACVVSALVGAYAVSTSAVPLPRLAYRSPYARFSLLVVASLFVLVITGAILSGTQASQACGDWPMCDLSILLRAPAGWLHLVHRLVVLLVGILLAVSLFKAWRSQRSQTVVLVATIAAAVLYFAQALLGARLVQGFPAYLLALHEATAVAVWAALAVQVTALGLVGRSAQDEHYAVQQAAVRRHMLSDLLVLTKPVVVALLLVTTFAGMVIGARAWPSLGLTLWTLLGGFMAAGGSGAINQYIDRFDDVKMQRTQKRPIPAGRLTPGEGLAFGVGMALASFYLMVAFVNLLAALLTLAGILYYVLLYSLLLKKSTVQNIVIGGGAGAIPPLVGWAAATGSLNIPALFLFAVVFLWTPPHFWALALVRRNDYARAGVPMLPVVRGEGETRRQVLIYTVELVGLTLVLPIFGLGGSIYFTGALALGGWLLATAWKVWRQGGNKSAWKMYRYSSMYLAFLFAVLVVDALL